MKIIHILYGMTLGGIETMLLNIANEQVKNHRVDIIVINNLVEKSLLEQLDKRVQVHCLKRKVSSKNPFFILKLNLLLYKLKPDIIHLHYSSILNFIFSKNFKKRSCVTHHDICTPINSTYLHKSEHLFSISNTVKEDLFRVKKIHSEVVLNGIKPDLIKKRESLVNDTGIFKIVQLSRLAHHKKGQHILIEAIKILKDKGIKTIQVFFIGEGESEEYLKELIHRYQLEEQVFFLGLKTQDFIFTHLCQYDLLVQASLFEGFGLTVAEGMAAKIPVLVSDNQGPMEIIDNGKFGYYFENGNPQSCADQIRKIMRDPSKKFLVEKAYKRVYELYNVEITANTYLKKYEEIINQIG
jgi:glycosyltransferase involved in cell wall biosynthesis